MFEQFGGKKILKYGWQIQKEDCICHEGFSTPHAI